MQNACAFCEPEFKEQTHRPKTIKPKESFRPLGFNWSGRQDLNLRPPAPHAGALPSCATPRQTLVPSGTQGGGILL